MTDRVYTCVLPEPKVDFSEVLRYASCAGDNSFLPLAEECFAEMQNELIYKVCYARFSVNVCHGVADFGFMTVKSQDLCNYLQNSNSVLIFAATVGLIPDRIVEKYSKISPTKSLFANAVGAERIEALCDDFCLWYGEKNKVKTRPRYSVGYGDFDIVHQKDIVRALNCVGHIGVTINESLLLSPTKSVTAFVGLSC